MRRGGDGVFHAKSGSYSYVGYNFDGTARSGIGAVDLIAEWTDTPEVGTLKEIGAQHGDQCGYGNGEWLKCTISMRDGEYYAKGEESDGELGGDQWRIITRAQPGPVRTVTRHEIVAGKYGNVTVWGDGWPSVKGVSNIDELTDAIQTLTAIRDAMQSNTTA